MKNSGGRYGGAITAGLFLQQFIEEVRGRSFGCFSFLFLCFAATAVVFSPYFSLTSLLPLCFPLSLNATTLSPFSGRRVGPHRHRRPCLERRRGRGDRLRGHDARAVGGRGRGKDGFERVKGKENRSCRLSRLFFSFLFY